MQKEKLFVVGMIVVIALLVSSLIILTNPDIFDNLFKTTDTIEAGDCADVNYIGRFQVNDTVFDTSYESVAVDADIYDENRTYEPLKVFVNPNQEFSVPEGYENYSSTLIEGFLNGLVGMMEGENKTVVIPPEEGYGVWNATLAEELWMSFIGKPYLPRTFSDNLTSTIPKTSLYNYNGTIDVENVTENQTITYLEGFTPEGNATLWQIQITNISGDNVTILNLVDNGTILKSEGSWDNVVIIENETVVTVKAIPEIGGVYGQQNSWIKVISFNETAIIVAINMESPEKKFINQTLVFELEVVDIYKTSEELS